MGLNPFAGEEDEKLKLSIGYLNFSLGNSRKRSRSLGDVGSGRPLKMLKLDNLSTPKGPNMKGLESPPTVAEIDDRTSASIVDDPVVMGAYVVRIVSVALMSAAIVDGQPVLFSQITEEHQEAMSTDEYTAYFEIIQAGM